MQRKVTRTKDSEVPQLDRFLRSINVTYDADDSSRIAHFRPTTKCATLLNALLGQENESAFLVVAPYGTGKSLTATYLLQLIENRPDASADLLTIAKRLSDVSPDLGRLATNRRRSKKRKGPVLALHGFCSSLPESLKQAAIASLKRMKLSRQATRLRKMPTDTIEDGIEILRELNEKCRASGCDRVVIIWDEFGRHLESLIAEGRGNVLGEIQLLAEYVARTRSLPTTLGLLLHQGLLHYAANAPQSVRNEWTKIEGRFSTIQYVDDSKEIYRLIADFVSERHDGKGITKRQAGLLARKCRALGLFSDFGQSELAVLLHTAYPLEPITLYLLPRVSARVAQNERTLFSFLHTANLHDRLTPSVLYDYFAATMRSDTAVGGTHRQWLETESAISKVPEDEHAVVALKSACLLGLGTSGERSRTSRELLSLALRGYANDKPWDSCITQLMERKLLLHRRHNDEVSVWHGTDLDLRGRLEDERRRLADEFDLVQFLTMEAAPAPWKPVEYNDDYCIRRFFEAEYQSVARLHGFLSWDVIIENLPIDCDGKIIYLIAETQDELEQAAEIARQQLSHPRLVIVIPREPLPLADAAVEVTSLSQMELDSELIESDPLALPEIQQMTDDARDHLQRLVDRLTRPHADGPRWFYEGKELPVENPRDLRRELSEIMRNVFRKTPLINNEVIVRKKPTPIMVNARKKLVLGILERHGQADLGIEGNFPDKSMFRTVLLHTGLYCQDRHGRWAYASPRSRGIRDKGLRGVWRKYQEFLTAPSKSPKEFQPFFEELMAPPYGLRAGVIPILFAAALKAFPSAISLTRDGEYVIDILPSEIERLWKQPERYRLLVLDLDDGKLKYLRALQKKFSAVGTYDIPENELVRLCFDAIEAWKDQLPPAALTTRRLSSCAGKFRDAISRTDDPVRLLFERIPLACGRPIEKPRALLNAVDRCIQELTAVAAIYAEQAKASLERSIGTRFSDNRESVRDIARRWSECFSDQFIEQLTDGIAKGLLSRLRMPYDTDELLINSLGSLIVGKPLGRWDDSTIAVFDREMHTIVRRIEDRALSSEGNVERDSAATDGVKELVRSRIDELYERLKLLVGIDEAREVLESIEGRNLEGVTTHGND